MRIENLPTAVKYQLFENKLENRIGSSEPKIILHLCADIGSDSRFYQLDGDYEVIKIGKELGVENYNPPKNVYGVIANPVCRGLTTIHGFDKDSLCSTGLFQDEPEFDKMFLVNECIRIINECNPVFWVIENPAKGTLRSELGKPQYIYQPWYYGSPWSKQTALWGNFNMPEPLYKKWEDVPNKINSLWKRKDRNKPCLAYLHKNDVHKIPEFEWARSKIKSDMDLRSMCSQGFAKAFYEANR